VNATLKVDRLCKKFGGIVVADDINLDLHPGEVVGLIGPNGAGKTTLFNLLTGFIAPYSGEIALQGERIERLPSYKRARLGIARTWQQPRLFPSLSILDNLLISDRSYPGETLLNTLFRTGKVREAERAARARAELLLSRVGLLRRANSLSTRLSYGQQKLVGLARALMNNGQCLLLDEPMAGVEGRVHETMKSIIRQEADSGKTVCIVEHNVGFIRDLCDRAAFMVNGRIIALGSVDSLMANRRLTDLYFGG
jgi:branched-chain amino acid transport system ATP-binding protein